MQFNCQGQKSIYKFCDHLQHFCDYCTRTCVCGITVRFKHLAMVQRAAAICHLSHLHCRLLYAVVTLVISFVHQSTSEQFLNPDPNSAHVLLRTYASDIFKLQYHNYSDDCVKFGVKSYQDHFYKLLFSSFVS